MANPKYAVSDKPVPVSELVATLSDGTKVKRRVPRMRACNEKDAKGKLCAGHLKRWYFFGDEVKQKFGADAEVYRCEHCKTLYLPIAVEEPRTGALSGSLAVERRRGESGGRSGRGGVALRALQDAISAECGRRAPVCDVVFLV